MQTQFQIGKKREKTHKQRNMVGRVTKDTEEYNIYKKCLYGKYYISFSDFFSYAYLCISQKMIWSSQGAENVSCCLEYYVLQRCKQLQTFGRRYCCHLTAQLRSFVRELVFILGLWIGNFNISNYVRSNYRTISEKQMGWTMEESDCMGNLGS